jgi:hypothetical protein
MTTHIRELLARDRDDLTSVERGRIDAHVATCTECRVFGADLERTDRLLTGKEPAMPIPRFEVMLRPRERALPLIVAAAGAFGLLLMLALAPILSGLDQRAGQPSTGTAQVSPPRCADASPQPQVDPGKALPLQPRSPLISCVLNVGENVGDYGFGSAYYRLVDGRDLQVNECRGCRPIPITDAKTRDIAGQTWYHTDVDGHYSLYTTLPDGTYVAFYVPRGKTDDADLELLTEIASTLR